MNLVILPLMVAAAHAAAPAKVLLDQEAVAEDEHREGKRESYHKFIINVQIMLTVTLFQCSACFKL